ncbi:Glutamine amidotransferase, class I [Candidatus Sumerlaea chitinivorans]|uniref:Glutamine amidotransferase, class I n=1 Tax=Sumerlaea chitinivorans TaxID=2250252 RepID=A0A2Z4Y279_SUMC1|nr:Glutamine amidotransferase, class I [Candidatus Sumerlaea chitinivorans]
MDAHNRVSRCVVSPIKSQPHQRAMTKSFLHIWLSVILLGGLLMSTTNLSADEPSAVGPIIGINTSIVFENENGASYATRDTYVRAVEQAGGLPILLPPIETTSSLEAYVALCQGFVLIGGQDIRSERYGKPPHPLEVPMPQKREEFDFQLISRILATKKPFLAICLGAQEITVALGGSLIQDIASQTSTSIVHGRRQHPSATRHLVHVEPGTVLEDIVGTTTLETNSSHHQAIETPGKGMRISARAEDGIIEACELEDYGFGLCVQWHPEALTDEAPHLALFRRLVDEAQAYRAK